MSAKISIYCFVVVFYMLQSKKYMDNIQVHMADKSTRRAKYRGRHGVPKQPIVLHEDIHCSGSQLQTDGTTDDDDDGRTRQSSAIDGSNEDGGR